MWTTKKTTPFDSFLDLLLLERKMILDGQLEGIGELSAKKTTAARGFFDSKPTPVSLNRIRHEMSRNQELLKAASLGLKTASQRLRDLLGAGNNHKLYGNDGTRVGVSEKRNKIERRA